MQTGRQVGTQVGIPLVLGGGGGAGGGGELIGGWLVSGCCVVVDLCGVESLLFDLILGV